MRRGTYSPSPTGDCLRAIPEGLEQLLEENASGRDLQVSRSGDRAYCCERQGASIGRAMSAVYTPQFISPVFPVFDTDNDIFSILGKVPYKNNMHKGHRTSP